MVRKMPSEPRHARRLLFRCAGESEPRHARRLVFRCAGEYRGSVANRHSVVLCEPGEFIWTSNGIYASYDM